MSETTKATHTPAPWWFEPRSSQVLAKRDAWNNWEVCMIGLRESFCPKAEERKANAHLIGAAPDLLAACKAFVEAWQRSHQLEKTDTALRLCESAIAKAEGRAP